MSVMLLNSAIDFRKAEVKDSSLTRDSTLGVKVLDSILNKNLSTYNIDFQWALFDGFGKPLDTTNNLYQTENSSDLILTTCISCLVMIDVLDDEGSTANNEGFILDQTPAQMIKMRGIDLSDLEYIHLFMEPHKFSMKPYIIPSVQ